MGRQALKPAAPATRPVFEFPVRVYYEDTDAGGVVYYANYLKFLERSRTEWLRSVGIEQPELLRDHNVIFVVRAVAIEYLRPARFNDALRVSAQINKLGRSTLEIFQTVERDMRLIEAQVKIVCVEQSSFKPIAIPAPIRQQLESLAPA